MTGSVLWLRRDLRRADHPALVAAASEGPVLPLVVIDATLWEGGGGAPRLVCHERRACARPTTGSWCSASVIAEGRAGGCAGGRRPGGSRDPRVDSLRSSARRAGREGVVAQDIRFISTGTPMPSGRVWSSRDGAPIRSSPLPGGLARPAGRPRRERRRILLSHLESDREAWSFVDDALSVEGLPPPPEPGRRRPYGSGAEFLDGELAAYDTDRDRPDRPGTSQLSPTSRSGRSTRHPARRPGGSAGPMPPTPSSASWRGASSMQMCGTTLPARGET